MKIECKNLDDTKKLAASFAKNLPDEGCFVSLYGDIGAGKTAFVRFVLKELGVKDKVTSPSFVILNEYLNYRIKTITEELSDYSKRNILTFVEWADFGSDALSLDRLDIKILYPDVLEYGENGDPRVFEFIPCGSKNEVFVQKIIETYEAQK